MSETKQKEKKGDVKVLKPTKEDVRKAVLSTIAGFTRKETASIQDDYELTKQPLSFDSNRLVFLAMNLRGYVLYYSNKEKTLKVKEIRKSGMTVGKLINLIYEKVQ